MARPAVPKNANCAAGCSMLFRHGSLAGWTWLIRRRHGCLPNRSRLVTMREKIQERRERRVQKFVVDLRFDAEELPYLPILESDFQDVIFCVVRERLHFRIVDLNSGDVERRDEVHAVLHPLFALPAKHHGAKNLGRSIYRTSVWYGKH